MNNFLINNKSLKIHSLKIKKKFEVKSGIRNYTVKTYYPLNQVKKLFNDKNNYFIIDKKVNDIYFKEKNYRNKYIVQSDERFKNIQEGNKIIDFFIKKKITKINNIYAIGGGIVQDLAGYTCYVFKRGIPWIYVPTTMLGQTDSCVGGKVALNYKQTKNLMALFSAPRKVLICVDFLKTTSEKDYLSGIGEAFRLHITGGNYFFRQFQKNLKKLKLKDIKTINKVISTSLLIKKTIVEFDEYEIDIRRSMNFGHSIGHAYESLLNYKLPHGLAVSLGICIELLLIKNKKNFSKKMLDEIIHTFFDFFPQKYLKLLKKIKLQNINLVLKKDKKTEGNVIKLAVPIQFGNMKFISQSLDKKNIFKINKANKELLFYKKN